MSLLLSADTQPLVHYVTNHIDLSGNQAASEVFPHIKRSMSVAQALVQTARSDILMASWQYSHETATPMGCEAGGMASQVIMCFSQLFTVMLFVASSHHYVFNADPSTLFGTFAKPAAAPTDNTHKTANPHLSQVALGSIFNLHGSLQKLDMMLNADAFANFDAMGFYLCRTINFVQNWSSQVRCFTLGCISRVMELSSKHLHDRVEELDSAVPRWDALFPAGVAPDWNLISTRILMHPRRNMVMPLIKHINAVTRDLENLRAATDATISLDPGIQSFIKTTLATAENYMLICAGVNTIMMPPSASTIRSSQEVLDISGKSMTIELPDSSKQALQQAACGKRIEGTASTSSSPASTSASSLAPPAKRLKVKTEPGTSTLALAPQPSPLPKSEPAVSAHEGERDGPSEAPTAEAPAQPAPGPALVRRRAQRAARQPRSSAA